MPPLRLSTPWSSTSTLHILMSSLTNIDIEVPYFKRQYSKSLAKLSLQHVLLLLDKTITTIDKAVEALRISEDSPQNRLIKLWLDSCWIKDLTQFKVLSYFSSLMGRTYDQCESIFLISSYPTASKLIRLKILIEEIMLLSFISNIR